MQKLEGSSPFVRLEESPDKSGAFPFRMRARQAEPPPALASSAHFENS